MCHFLNIIYFVIQYHIHGRFHSLIFFIYIYHVFVKKTNNKIEKDIEEFYIPYAGFTSIISVNSNVKQVISFIK